MSNYLRLNFQNYANAKDLISSVAFEQLLKSLGIRISRRQINRLARLNNIRSPVKNYGSSPNGNRQFYDYTALCELLTLKFVENCIEIKGANYSAKLDIVRYAKEQVEALDKREESFDGLVGLSALIASSSFAKDTLYGLKRLEQIKRINVAIKQAIYVWYFANTLLVKSAENYSIVKMWGATRNYALNGTVLGKFAKELTQFGREDDSKNFLDPTRFNSLNKEQRESLKCWIEIMMTFRSEKLIVAEIARNYMMVKFGIDVDLDVSAINLLALNRYLS